MSRKAYHAHADMLRRCYDSSRRAYRWYGAQGVVVDIRLWRYEDFLACVGQPPYPEDHLDRKDGLDFYRPGNVGWVDMYDSVTRKRRYGTGS